MFRNKEKEGRKIQALASVIDLLMKEVEDVFASSDLKSLPEQKANILREILWRNLEHAFNEGSSQTHGLELKIEFLEQLLKDKREENKEEEK